MAPREALVLRKLNGVLVFRDALTFTNRDAIARSALHACACCFRWTCGNIATGPETRQLLP